MKRGALRVNLARSRRVELALTRPDVLARRTGGASALPVFLFPGRLNCKGVINMSNTTIQPHTYRVGNTTFIVTPVYAMDKGEPLISILLKLMKSDLDKI